MATATAPAPTNTAAANAKIPPDKINVRVIVITGQTVDLLCLPDESAQSIVDRLYESWPSNWDPAHKPATNILRLIYQGRFLHGSVTLSGLNLPLGKTVVMHVVPREQLPEPGNQDKLKKDKEATTTRECRCCTIL